MISSAYSSPGFDTVAPTPVQDAAYGLQYTTRVLETDGFQDYLAVNEAPKLSQAAGNNLVSHAVLQAQVEDAARVGAADPATQAIVQRLRTTTQALAQPPPEPISSVILNGLTILGGILSVVLGILPYMGFAFSPWLMLAPLALSIGAYLGQLVNSGGVVKARERQVAEHEDQILALLRRADELRAQMMRQAQQTAHLSLDAPALPAPQYAQQ